ncbi:MAG: hypothetical protein ACHQNE_06370 [Candidatus Kapaibacterium sp.]
MNLNFWNRLFSAGFGPREDDRSSVLGGFLQIEPWNRLSASSAMLIAGLCLLFLSIFTSQAVAVTDTLLSTETFASGLPGTWSDDGSWFSSSNGNGGSNGSMYCDMYDYIYSPDYLTAPTVDASNYATDADSVWVDFDFSW